MDFKCPKLFRAFRTIVLKQKFLATALQVWAASDLLTDATVGRDHAKLVKGKRLDDRWHV